jgi:hypothetical protein
MTPRPPASISVAADAVHSAYETEGASFWLLGCFVLLKFRIGRPSPMSAITVDLASEASIDAARADTSACLLPHSLPRLPLGIPRHCWVLARCCLHHSAIHAIKVRRPSLALPVCSSLTRPSIVLSPLSFVIARWSIAAPACDMCYPACRLATVRVVVVLKCCCYCKY